MNVKTVNILGQDYDIKLCTTDESEGVLTEERDGICDTYSHEILVTDYVNSHICEERTERIKTTHIGVTKAVLRHELVHAILKESGLDESSEFAKNELLVDWIALQLPKIVKIMLQAGAFTNEDIAKFSELIDKQKQESECDFI